MRCLKLFVFSLLMTSASLFSFTTTAYAQTQDWAAINPNCVGNSDQTYDVATITGLECAFSNVLSVALRFLGLVMFIMLIIGGFRYLTAGGDPKAVEAAQGTITLAIAGLVMAILAWFILILISQFTGLKNLTTFTINPPPPKP